MFRYEQNIRRKGQANLKVKICNHANRGLSIVTGLTNRQSRRRVLKLHQLIIGSILKADGNSDAILVKFQDLKIYVCHYGANVLSHIKNEMQVARSRKWCLFEKSRTRIKALPSNSYITLYFREYTLDMALSKKQAYLKNGLIFRSNKDMSLLQQPHVGKPSLMC